MLEMIGIYGEMRSYVKFSLHEKCLDTFRTILKDSETHSCYAFDFFLVHLGRKIYFFSVLVLRTFFLQVCVTKFHLCIYFFCSTFFGNNS